MTCSHRLTRMTSAGAVVCHVCKRTLPGKPSREHMARVLGSYDVTRCGRCGVVVEWDGEHGRIVHECPLTSCP